MTKTTDQIIITSQPEAAVIALNEIQKTDPAARGKRLSPETQLVTLSRGYDSLHGAHPIFIRHIFPVNLIIENLSSSLDAPQYLAELGSSFPKDLPFSIQMRCIDHAHRAKALDNLPATTKDLSLAENSVQKTPEIIQATEEALLSAGYIKSDAHPIWVISVVICQDILYAGASYTVHNLSDWNGGMHRFKKDDSFISRAEFKLQEALSDFDINIPALGIKTALDLGAAPGGWTKILLDNGLCVTAVDPADLSESLAHHPNLIHVKDVAQRFLRSKKGPFDILVNDMRMDMMESCKIMLDAAPLLTSGGLAVMTLKLPRSHWYKSTKRALSLLKKAYTVQNARQLFHNRSEVTIVLNINSS